MFIDKKSLVLLLKNKKISSWQTRKVNFSEQEIKWLKILSYKGPNSVMKHNYGLNENGSWVAERGDRAHIDSEGQYTPFLPLLELPKIEIVSMLREAIYEVGLPDVVLYTFPFDELMVHGLSCRYSWAKLCQQWIYEGYPLNEEIAQLMPDQDYANKWRKERLRKIFEE